MTVKEFAAAHGVTPQAVYKRLRASCQLSIYKVVNPKDSANAGQITTEGMELLNKLYPADNSVNKPLTTDDKPVDNGLQMENERLKAENEKLTVELSSARQTISQLTGALSALTAAHENTTEALKAAQRLTDQAQQLQAMQIKALPGGGVKAWISKIFRGRGKAE